ncbi:TasA family protein [Arthrobacter sp. TMN-37]
MSAASTRPSRRPRARLIAACAVAATGLAITGGGVYAALTATATNITAQSATSGILSLTMASTGTGSNAGFSQAISNLAPGDTVNRYVTLTQGAGLDGKDLTLSVKDSTPTLLTTDATRGLHVTVTQCPGTWNPATGNCSGTPIPLLLNNVPVSTLTPAAPGVVKYGAIPSNTVLNLQVSVTLPDQNETTINGAIPTGSIQNLSSSLTWTFSETQRTATTTGS